ncbi:hypothetical protein TIFTF001_019228 [Ficus carica]|uniref:Uncharacterized protein n=1 Tax=Ficus carica TaxID=3494 RepID=A0AA88DJD3_FICCA|nr:hypothetical protein TIFTF001_019228 [Ficus carica]
MKGNEGEGFWAQDDGGDGLGWVGDRESCLVWGHGGIDLAREKWLDTCLTLSTITRSPSPFYVVFLLTVVVGVVH